MNYKSASKAASIATVSVNSVAEISQPERHIQQFLNALNSSEGKPIEQLSPQAARQVLIDAQKGANLPAADVSEKTINIEGGKITLNIVKPHNSQGILPVFMFFHGGGWILGDFQTHERLVRDLVRGSGAAAVFVNYAPSPEAHFPLAINQAYAATRWVAENGSEIGVDGTRLALVGNSVGGNMVAAVALQAKQQKAPVIRYNIMLWPVTDANFNTESYHQFENGYFLSRNMMKWFWDAYTTKESDRHNILAAPLRATTGQLQGLSPTLIQTAEFDVLRDEGESFGRKLDAAGVDVTVTRYHGLIHDYGLLNALSDVPAVRTAIAQAAYGLRDHLK